MRLPRLYPIADAETLVRHGLPLIAFVQQIVAGGAEIVQRKIIQKYGIDAGCQHRLNLI